MLTLTRKIGEQILIVAGDANITVKVLDVDYSSGQIRLGIAAPPEVSILRQELLEEEAMGRYRARNSSRKTDR